MNEYKLLFLDIDGTIIRPDDSIEESTKQAVFAVQKKGLDVFLATGRPIHEILDIAKELNINSFIGYNGAYGIYKGEILFQEAMDEKTVFNFVNISNKYHHEAVLYTDSENAFTSLETPVVEKFIKKFHLHKNTLCTPDMFTNVLGMTLIGLKENDSLHYEWEDGVHLSQINLEGMKNCYDVIRDKVNKGFGIEVVLKHLGVAKEEAIAFGDGLNDKEMLMSVGEGFAMGNGHPDLFGFAKHKTTSVTDSGVFNGLKMLGLVD
jgi:Cof subfamily protein (haloacid dehalogenase superfamily)